MFARLMGLKTVSPGDLNAMRQSPGVTIIDVNSRPSWLRARVPGAVHLDPANFTAADLPANKANGLVFYCSNAFCRKAPSAARRAEKMGYRDVQVMSAGISGWLSAGLPTAAGE